MSRQQNKLRGPARLVLGLALIGWTACGDDGSAMQPDASVDAAGPPGIAEGIFADMGEPIPAASPEQLGTFERGLAVAKRRFSPEEGLGPHFNVTFCAACHEKPVFGGSGARYRNFLLLGQVLPDETYIPVGVQGIQPQYQLGENGRFPTPEEANVTATRNPIPFFGAGLLAEISDEEILLREDPEDADGDGISGRANFIMGFVGRFGRKAQNASIEQFIRGPLNNHLGITSNPLPEVRRAQLPVNSAGGDPAGDMLRLGLVTPPQAGAPDEPLFDSDGVPDPELGEDDLFDLVSFSMLLAAPTPDEPTPESERGRQLFEDANCTGCHTPALLGPRGLIPAYTDLLIHDMGPELADGVRMELASESEYRSAPLWGVAATAPYLHDGRADTLDAAIRWHGGEAEAARDAYVAMSQEDRDAVIAFLRSLGGASQASEGLVPPGTPIAEVGDYGGPEVELTAEEQASFLRGRSVFDRDFGLEQGLGPLFNGDACRACHFDPVIGGAGPADVNAMRHGIVNPDTGAFTAPDIGTLAHKFSVATDERAYADPAATVFEPRQTPPIFGFGQIARIGDDTILALADPDDNDGDGISGRAHVLADGRLGRLGWKANVPSVAEFARDGMTNELGITVPDQPGLTFGAGTDGDDAADPEISLEDLEALVFYMNSLAPPPRTRLFPDIEDEGEQIFADIGCAACHVPSLPDGDGNPVNLYSDILLHDVAPAYLLGIEDGDASMREFRTAPLWGLATSAPYMHDGSAYTIEDAILQHDSEAKSARDAYLALPPTPKEALLFFLESL